MLGADGMLYQTTEDLLSVGHELNPSIEQFEASCFNGAPPAVFICLGCLRAACCQKLYSGCHVSAYVYCPFV